MGSRLCGTLPGEVGRLAGVSRHFFQEQSAFHYVWSTYTHHFLQIYVLDHIIKQPRNVV